MTDDLLNLLCGLAKRGYSIYMPTNEKCNYFTFSNGERIFNAQSDLIFGLTCSMCYVPSREHGSSTRIANVRNDNYNIAYKAVETYSNISLESLNISLNKMCKKHKSNVKLYKDENDWWEKNQFKKLYKSFKKSSLKQFKRGYSKETFTKVIVNLDNESFEVSIDFYHGIKDLNQTISTYIFNRQLTHFQGKEVNILLLQNGKYALTKIKTISL